MAQQRGKSSSSVSSTASSARSATTRGPVQPSLEHFSDRLFAAISAKGAPVCVGIDPVAERLPAALRDEDRMDSPEGAVDAIYEFCTEIIDAVAEIVPVVKFQSACFERYRHDGVEALYSLIDEAAARGLIVILDAKRGDIGLSAEHYAASAFDARSNSSSDDRGADPAAAGTTDGGSEAGAWSGVADALTINPYFGMDGVEPFCRRPGRGAFALVRTSNRGGTPIQQARMEGGESMAEFMARQVHEMGQSFMGEAGYSDLGAVVGATHPDEITRLRHLMPQTILLVPGYGAQGGRPEDVSACFNRDGRGAIITASRSVIFAYEQPDKPRAQGRSVESTAHAAAGRARSKRAARQRAEDTRGAEIAAGAEVAETEFSDPADAALTGAGDSPRWIDHIAEAAAAFAHEIRQIVGK